MDFVPSLLLKLRGRIHPSGPVEAPPVPQRERKVVSALATQTQHLSFKGGRLGEGVLLPF